MVHTQTNGPGEQTDRTSEAHLPTLTGEPLLGSDADTLELLVLQHLQVAKHQAPHRKNLHSKAPSSR